VVLAQANARPKDLSWTNESSAHFTINLTLSTTLGPVTITRGYKTSATLRLRSAPSASSTALEASANPIRRAQASELLNGVLSDATQTQVLVGDINSDPHQTGTNPYDLFASAGFSDSWT
jgi:hypothetical protein